MIYLKIKDKIHFLLRRIFEFFRYDFLSKPYSVDGIENHLNLLKYLNYNNGKFIEVGGFDGFFHSPTYYLEKFKNWHGAIIEPSRKYCDLIYKNRKKTTLIYNNLITSKKEMGKNFILLENGVFSKKKASFSKQNNTINNTLENIIIDLDFKSIDLISIDVEGSEMEVLESINFNNITIKYLLIEILDNNKNDFDKFLNQKGFKFCERISKRDYLYANKSNT